MSGDDNETAAVRTTTPGRRDILEAAATAFTRGGYTATTIDDIAREMGATKGRVYHYYRAKADVFLDIVTTGMQELIDGVQPIAGNTDLDPATRLWRMAHHHAGLMMTRNSFQRVAMRDRYEQLFADVIDEGRQAGVFRDVDSRLATKPLLGALNWISLWYDPQRGDYNTRQRVADEYADFILGGLRRSPR